MPIHGLDTVLRNRLVVNLILFMQGKIVKYFFIHKYSDFFEIFLFLTVINNKVYFIYAERLYNRTSLSILYGMSTFQYFEFDLSVKFWNNHQTSETDRIPNKYCKFLLSKPLSKAIFGHLRNLIRSTLTAFVLNT